MSFASQLAGVNGSASATSKNGILPNIDESGEYKPCYFSSPVADRPSAGEALSELVDNSGDLSNGAVIVKRDASMAVPKKKGGAPKKRKLHASEDLLF